MNVKNQGNCVKYCFGVLDVPLWKVFKWKMGVSIIDRWQVRKSVKSKWFVGVIVILVGNFRCQRTKAAPTPSPDTHTLALNPPTPPFDCQHNCLAPSQKPSLSEVFAKPIGEKGVFTFLFVFFCNHLDLTVTK